VWPKDLRREAAHRGKVGNPTQLPTASERCLALQESDGIEKGYDPYENHEKCDFSSWQLGCSK